MSTVSNRLHDPIRDFRDNCGFALLAHMDGEKSHWLVETTLESLARLTHRGAVASDGKSGDGCGIMLQFPEPFLRDVAVECGFRLTERFASGLVFFSPNAKLIARGKKILTRHLRNSALEVAGWREVPTCPEVVGKQALASMPAIYQVFVNAPAGWRSHDIERQLFAARRLAFEEERALTRPDPLYYVVTLSNLTMVYKGLVQAEHLGDFFPDLRDERMTTAVGICHQRFSTNTLPRWNYAQPFRYLAHNGEINSVNANRDWANARGAILHSPLLPRLEELSHLVNQGGSDSSSLDNLLEVFLAGGMDLFRAMRLLLPPAIREDMDPDLKAFLEFNSMHQEPWDGPAGVVATNGRIASCNMDRNGLRPARYSITHDGVFTVASETGVWDCPPERIKRRGRLGPGEMIAVDTETGRLWKNNAIDDMLKATHAYREWMTENMIRVRTNDEQERRAAERFMRESARELPAFQKMFGLGAEEIETVINPMALEAQEPVGSMGDDTPLAVLSTRNRSIFDYFRQSFAQVTNPPIDPLRESAVMSLETCIGREHNVFHETASHAYRVLLPWPVLNYVKYQTLLGLDQRYYRNVRFSLNYDPDSQDLKAALEDLSESCVSAVHGGATILVLSDRDLSRDRLPMPAPLAVGAVHQGLLRARLLEDDHQGVIRVAHHGSQGGVALRCPGGVLGHVHDRQLVPLRTQLKNGQTVEIITADGAHPSPAWLGFVVSAKARSNIRHYQKNMKREEAIELGRRMLDRALAVFDVDADAIPGERLAALLAQYGAASHEDLLEEVGLGRRPAVLVARALAPVEDGEAFAGKPVAEAARDADAGDAGSDNKDIEVASHATPTRISRCRARCSRPTFRPAPVP